MCSMSLKKGFNGPPTARSEPGRDHPCYLAIVTTVRLARLFEGRWSRPVNCTRIHETYPSITDMPHVQPLLNSPSKALGIQCPIQIHKEGGIGHLTVTIIKWRSKGIEPSPYVNQRHLQGHRHWSLHQEKDEIYVGPNSMQVFS